MQMPYLPHEVVVSQILPRLPVRSLLRYQCVCKAWRQAISHDGSFHRAFLRLQNSALLMAPQIKTNDRRRYNLCDIKVTTASFYSFDMQDAPTLLLRHSSPNNEEVHVLAHCDGLVLLSAGGSKVRVLNPATRRFLTLPWSTHAVKPARFPPELAFLGHQALGLGRDPSSNTYKVARFFYRSVHLDDGGGYRCNPGMEVLTIGAEHRWRETTAQPLYPVVPQQTATFFKGSLIWTMEEMFHGVQPGFLRFSLEHESFSVMAPPPTWRPYIHSKAAGLTEVRGELWLCGSPEPWNRYGPMDIWISNDLGDGVQTQWERRYVLHGVPRSLRLICMFDEEMVFQAEPYYHLWIYKQPYGVSKNVISLEDLRFHDPHNDTTVQYPREVLQGCDAIPYVPSILPL